MSRVKELEFLKNQQMNFLTIKSGTRIRISKPRREENETNMFGREQARDFLKEKQMA